MRTYVKQLKEAMLLPQIHRPLVFLLLYGLMSPSYRPFMYAF